MFYNGLHPTSSLEKANTSRYWLSKAFRCDVSSHLSVSGMYGMNSSDAVFSAVKVDILILHYS